MPCTWRMVQTEIAHAAKLAGADISKKGYAIVCNMSCGKTGSRELACFATCPVKRMGEGSCYVWHQDIWRQTWEGIASQMPCTWRMVQFEIADAAKLAGADIFERGSCSVLQDVPWKNWGKGAAMFCNKPRGKTGRRELPCFARRYLNTNLRRHYVINALHMRNGSI